MPIDLPSFPTTNQVLGGSTGATAIIATLTDLPTQESDGNFAYVTDINTLYFRYQNGWRVVDTIDASASPVLVTEPASTLTSVANNATGNITLDFMCTDDEYDNITYTPTLTNNGAITLSDTSASVVASGTTKTFTFTWGATNTTYINITDTFGLTITDPGGSTITKSHLFVKLRNTPNTIVDSTIINRYGTGYNSLNDATGTWNHSLLSAPDGYKYMVTDFYWTSGGANNATRPVKFLEASDDAINWTMIAYSQYNPYYLRNDGYYNTSGVRDESLTLGSSYPNSFMKPSSEATYKYWRGRGVGQYSTAYATMAAPWFLGEQIILLGVQVSA